jgi:GNAT superfamily N-acetyltransferase
MRHQVGRRSASGTDGYSILARKWRFKPRFVALCSAQRIARLGAGQDPGHQSRDRAKTETEVQIMSENHHSGGTYRKLWPAETDRYRDHLMRLDKTTRRMRFAHGVSDGFIEDYAARVTDLGSVVYAFFLDGEARAAAELRKLGDTWGREAEAAFSVEPAFQDQGIGTALMGRVIRAARNRGVQQLYMSCLAENTKMQVIARKHGSVLRFEYGEVIGNIMPEDPNYFSILAEAMEDRVGYMMAVLDLQSRIVQAA